MTYLKTINLIIDIITAIASVFYGCYLIVKDPKPVEGKMTISTRIAISGIILIALLNFLTSKISSYIVDKKAEEENDAKQARWAKTEQYQQAVIDSLKQSLTASRIQSSLLMKQQIAINDAVIKSQRILYPLDPIEITLEMSFSKKDSVFNSYLHRVKSLIGEGHWRRFVDTEKDKFPLNNIEEKSAFAILNEPKINIYINKHSNVLVKDDKWNSHLEGDLSYQTYGLVFDNPFYQTFNEHTSIRRVLTLDGKNSFSEHLIIYNPTPVDNSKKLSVHLIYWVQT